MPAMRADRRLEGPGLVAKMTVCGSSAGPPAGPWERTSDAGSRGSPGPWPSSPRIPGTSVMETTPLRCADQYLAAPGRGQVKQKRQTVGQPSGIDADTGTAEFRQGLTDHKASRPEERLQLPNQGRGRCDPIAVGQLEDLAGARRIEPQVHLGHARMGGEDLLEPLDNGRDAARDWQAYHHRA